jgi:hypothetical protein
MKAWTQSLMIVKRRITDRSRNSTKETKIKLIQDLKRKF